MEVQMYCVRWSHIVNLFDSCINTELWACKLSRQKFNSISFRLWPYKSYFNPVVQCGVFAQTNLGILSSLGHFVTVMFAWAELYYVMFINGSMRSTELDVWMLVSRGQGWNTRNTSHSIQIYIWYWQGRTDGFLCQ